MTRLRRRVLRRTQSRDGAGNKYTFRKVSQIVFSQGFASAKCMYFRKLSQICFRRISVRQYDFACIRELSRKFANMGLQCFASFRNLSQAFAIHGFATFKLQAFARSRKDSQMDFRKDLQVQKSCFFARIRNGHFADGAAAAADLRQGRGAAALRLTEVLTPLGPPPTRWPRRPGIGNNSEYRCHRDGHLQLFTVCAAERRRPCGADRDRRGVPALLIPAARPGPAGLGRVSGCHRACCRDSKSEAAHLPVRQRQVRPGKASESR